MTNRTLLLALGTLTACATSAEPVQTLDFSVSDLVELPAPPKPPGPLGKRAIRAAIQGVQAQLARCARTVTHPAGAIEVTLSIGAESVVEDAQVNAFGNAAIGNCMHDLLVSLELPAMTEPGHWTVHYPFAVGANR